MILQSHPIKAHLGCSSQDGGPLLEENVQRTAWGCGNNRGDCRQRRHAFLHEDQCRQGLGLACRRSASSSSLIKICANIEQFYRAPREGGARRRRIAKSSLANSLRAPYLRFYSLRIIHPGATYRTGKITFSLAFKALSYHWYWENKKRRFKPYQVDL